MNLPSLFLFITSYFSQISSLISNSCKSTSSCFFNFVIHSHGQTGQVDQAEISHQEVAFTHQAALTLLPRRRQHPATMKEEEDSKDLHAVYVGKSRRRYYLSSDVILHPLFQELVERSGRGGGFDGGDASAEEVACEVVLFEHLVWMINESTGGGGGAQLGSMQELVEFYTC